MISGSIEGAGRQESPQTIESWLEEIEFNWRDIPEFKVDPRRLGHLAIICDGNRRAAREKGLDSYFGHRAGVEVIKGILQAGRKWGIHTLTFWVWSTENWEREDEQVKFVMSLAAQYLGDEGIIEELNENQVRFTHFGRKDRLHPEIRKAITDLEERTASFDRFQLNMAMDYGGLDEVARAFGRIFADFRRGTFDPENFQHNPQAILGFLDSANQALPDLVVRTGTKEGEIPHTSGFMPLQTTYSSWVFSPDLFPNLSPQVLLEQIQNFLGYERRMGK